MPVKDVKQEVKHLVIRGPVGELDARIAELLNSGWKIIEGKLTQMDNYEHTVTVFYILARDVG